MQSFSASDPGFLQYLMLSRMEHAVALWPKKLKLSAQQLPSSIYDRQSSRKEISYQAFLITTPKAARRKRHGREGHKVQCFNSSCSLHFHISCRLYKKFVILEGNFSKKRLK